MAKKAMDDLLKRRMSATQQASELQATDEAYAKLSREIPPEANVRICNLLLDKLIAFSSADIGFKPYTQAQLEEIEAEKKRPTQEQRLQRVEEAMSRMTAALAQLQTDVGAAMAWMMQKEA